MGGLGLAAKRSHHLMTRPHLPLLEKNSTKQIRKPGTEYDNLYLLLAELGHYKIIGTACFTVH